MRDCLNLSILSFECCDWKACVTSKSWVGLPVPYPSLIASGAQSMFPFVKAVLQGSWLALRSCRVMVVGPQMVRALALIGHRLLTAATGWENKPDQRSAKRAWQVSAYRP